MNYTAQKFPTRTMDRALAAMDALFIPIIQLEMEFDFLLDEHRLAKAVSLLLEAEPILGCRFVRRILRPYWKSVEKDKSNVFTLTKNEIEYEAFKKKGIDFLSAPQILACLYRSESADRLTIKISHLVSDAAGVKDITATLSTIYNRLDEEPGFHPDPNHCDSRSFRQITKHVPWAVRPRIVFNYLHETIKSVIPNKTHGVPVKNTSENAGKYITRHIEKEELTNMIQYAKNRNATINDVLLAAIFRAYSRMGGWDGKAALRMAMTIDLRRYLPEKKAESISNFSSMEILTYGTAMEDDFEATLARIVEMVNKRKSSWLGLSAFISLYLVLWAFPYAGLTLMTKKGWESKANSPNAFDWFTNMGNISVEQVNFGGKPSRALLLPPGCNLPLFFFGCSSYDGSLSFSASIMPDAENEMSTNRFFDLIVSELPLSQLQTTGTGGSTAATNSVSAG
ncbi:hypothetical protein Dvar_10670 [Desulfosarcina variabilis str. Montpellier]